jgi:UDP-glucuronate 4-epimerase
MQTVVKRILVTGGAGFIGSTLTEALLAQGHEVMAIDNFDPYYPEEQKRANIQAFLSHPRYRLVEADILDPALPQMVRGHFDAVVHLAAKAGVRPSIIDPVSYQEVNVKGTQNLLELAKTLKIKQFVFGSSSSVYGINPQVPWRESDYVLQPISPYASSKISGELLGHVYSHLYGIRFIALRLFSVYGPRQRPDLAIHMFAHKILRGESIPVFGDGSTSRDYTYVGDIVQGILAAIAYDASPYEVINLGNGNTLSLTRMIEILEDALGKKALIERLPDQPGDVPLTSADISKAQRLLGYAPQVQFPEGIAAFVRWMRKAAVHA